MNKDILLLVLHHLAPSENSSRKETSSFRDINQISTVSSLVSFISSTERLETGVHFRISGAHYEAVALLLPEMIGLRAQRGNWVTNNVLKLLTTKTRSKI